MVYHVFHFRPFQRHLTAFLVTRAIFAGAGTVRFDGGPLFRVAQRSATQQGSARRSWRRPSRRRAQSRCGIREARAATPGLGRSLRGHLVPISDGAAEWHRVRVGADRWRRLDDPLEPEPTSPTRE